MNVLDLLPERYRSSIFIDEEAAFRAYLDDVRALAVKAVNTACWIDNQFGGWSSPAQDVADELHSAAAVVVENVEQEAAAT